MANRIGAGGPFLQSTVIVDGVPPLVDDDACGSWWSGQQTNFASIAIKSAAAALALSSSLCLALQQSPQDEFPFPNTVSAGESWTVLKIGTDPIVQAFTADEEVLPVICPDDESIWTPVWVSVPATILGPVWNDEQVVPTVDEDYSWSAKDLFLTPSKPQQPITDSGEWTPPPAPTVVDDEYWFRLVDDQVTTVIIEWPGKGAGGIPFAPAPIADEYEWGVYTPLPLSAKPLYLPDPEEVVAQTVQPALDDGSGWALLTASFAQVFTTSWVNGDEVGTLPPTLADDEYYWSYRVRAVDPDDTVFSSNDEWVPASTAVALDDGYWLYPVDTSIQTVIVEWPGKGAGGIPVAGSSSPMIDEEYWYISRTTYSDPYRGVFLADDEVAPGAAVVAPGDGVTTPGSQRKFITPTIWMWEFTDELPIAATPLQIVEPEWQVYTPPLVPARPLYLPDPEEIPAAFLRGTVEEEYWSYFKPLVVNPVAPLWAEDDQIVPLGTLLHFEESEWVMPTIPVVRPFVNVWATDDEVVTAVATTIFGDDSDWQVYVAPADTRRVAYYVPVDPEVLPPAPLHVDEDPYWPFRPIIPPLMMPYWIDQDEFPGAASLHPVSRIGWFMQFLRKDVVFTQVRIKEVEL